MAVSQLSWLKCFVSVTVLVMGGDGYIQSDVNAMWTRG